MILSQNVDASALRRIGEGQSKQTKDCTRGQDGSIKNSLDRSRSKGA